MSGAWYTLKFVPDLFVNQPYNVGVICVAGAQVEARFLGERDDGQIDGRRLPRDLPTQTFRDWVAFTRRAAEAGALDERISRLVERGGDQFIIEKRGPVFQGSDLSVVVDELYARVVTMDHGPARPTPSVGERAEAIVRSLDVELERDVSLKVTDRKGVEHLLPFAYRHTGRSTTLLDRVALRDQGRESSAAVESLLYRIDLAETAGGITDFLLFYKAVDDTRAVDRTLRMLERYANAVDVEEPDAAQQAADVLEVGLLPSSSVESAVRV